MGESRVLCDSRIGSHFQVVFSGEEGIDAGGVAKVLLSWARLFKVRLA